MAIDNADLLKRLEEALDILDNINEGGESSGYAYQASTKVESVIDDLKLLIDDGR